MIEEKRKIDNIDNDINDMCGQVENNINETNANLVGINTVIEQ